jgi:phosphatidylserine/phosphatidylglycerophosphate/cardiolipin synthase-like enzyme
MRLSALERNIVSRLSVRASLAASMLLAWSKLAPGVSVNAKLLTSCAGLLPVNERGVHEILLELLELGAATQAEGSYQANSALRQSMGTLAISMAAIDHYSKEVHKDDTEARVILTRPSQSTEFDQQLNNRGWHTSALDPTGEAFTGLIQRATARVVIMTPFLDCAGARWLKDLIFNARAGVLIQLILRSLEDPSRDDYPEGLALIAPLIAERGGEVLNYSIPREGGIKRETFHAKIILADRVAAYVGSANLTGASRDYSMEVGVVLQGKGAREVAEVVEAVIRSSTRVVVP